MTEHSPQELIDELDLILDEEREALVAGQIEKLEPLLARKEALIGSLNDFGEVERATLSHVHEKVTRNQVLLDSAMEGIRAVASRMKELRRVRKGLDVYNRAGQKTSYSTTNSIKLEKRA